MEQKYPTGLSVEIMEHLSGREVDSHIAEGITRLLESLPEEHPRLYVTFGLYPNDEWKYNYVEACDLVNHIKYNITMRFGRALFVNNICVYQGMQGKERCDEWEKKIPLLVNQNPTQNTRKYR